MQSLKKAKLILENGLEFQGFSFGYDQPASGEVVFNTAMVGYPENLTDPSYSGQVLCITYPIVGNYGVPADIKENGISKSFESDKIHVKALVISDYSFNYSHWNAAKSLDTWMKEEKIPGIFGVDTRELARIIREEGEMLCKLVPQDCKDNVEFYNPNSDNQIALVSCTEVKKYNAGEGRKKVVLLDCGVKNHLLRCLINRGVEVIQVPWDYDFNRLEYDGLFISNGPGNPEFCNGTVENIRKAIERNKPILGICMGNQLLAKAAGAQTYKLKCGHRSANQPVRLCGTDSCFITSQNHGYAVDAKTLGKDWTELFVNMNDGTCEGVKHNSGRFVGAQFTPEAADGPTDTDFLFDDFIKML